MPEAGDPRSAPRLTVRARRVEGAPRVAVRVWLRGGSRLESLPGQALVCARSLVEGSRRRDWRRIAEEAESRGAALGAAASPDGLRLAVDALADDWERALEWAAELVLEPVFPEPRVRWVTEQAAAELAALADEPEVFTAWSFLDQLYHPHPLGRPLQGSREALERLTADDCRRFHRRALAWGVVVSVAGRIDPDAAAARARELFASLAGAAQRPPAPPRPRGRGRRHEQALAAGDQAHLYLGHLTLERRHPDLPALALAGVALGAGAGLEGRIPARLREREGLAYAVLVETAAGAGLDPGHLEVYLATSPEHVERAVAGVEEELRRLVEEGLEPEELEAARSYLLGRLPFRRETAGQWAEILLQSILHGQPLESRDWVEGRLRGVGRAACEAAVRRHLRPDELRITVGRPPQSVCKNLRKSPRKTPREARGSFR